MIVRINRIKNSNSRGTIVEVASDYGTIEATWMGEVPDLQKLYDVEFDIPIKLRWGNEIKKSNHNSYSIYSFSEGTCLIGKIVSSDRVDNCTLFKIGNNNVLLETIGEVYEAGSMIEVTTPEVLLYNTHV
ncbi:hypothetical protein IC619_013860 [Hazenella sp. IB182353]|uniref:hypothetical protein n=1 Tax=Polycladospora coralii TaxID=2771432 RepID=UPI001746197F|nr:hypothetical protein [Polycladospora coralii]MBS7531569.1 hypothetical protein [Polycladospora coralii]